ncbi:hypothetical protein [Arthrobacter rhombi]|uniref:hypothetical protein n=1 Tax=Arthrobacter rhombi TaxID=71253 RepID=UPI003FD039B7
MTASHHHSQVYLALAEDSEGQREAAPWIGPLLALGTRISRFVQDQQQRQLVVVVSVPKRDYAAALIGCGWAMAGKAPVLPDPLSTLRSIDSGTPLRVVNDLHVITGIFSSLDESAKPPRARFAGSDWLADRFRALAVLPRLESAERTARPEIGSIGHFAGLDEQWDARLAAPAADLAIVGTVAWLKNDFNAVLSFEGDGMQGGAIHDVLLPDIGRVATWSTRVYPTAGLADLLPLPDVLRCAVLDGAAATKYVTDIEATAVVCVLDRSVADESAAEVLIQLRSMRGEPVSIQQDLGWRAPTGVEALAFTVPL